MTSNGELASVRTLIRNAVRAYRKRPADSESRWQWLKRILDHEDRSAVLRECRELARSSSVSDRKLVADLLSALSAVEEDPVRKREVLEILLPMLRDAESDVLSAAVVAVGRWAAAEHADRLVDLERHPSSEVRRAVAEALGDAQTPSAADALIRLARDPVAQVRSWATLGLARAEYFDDERIRQALLAATADADDEVRGEALLGLAERRDRRVIPILLQYLRGDTVGSLAIQAAIEIASPELYRALVELREWSDAEPKLIEQAIAACRPVREPD